MTEGLIDRKKLLEAVYADFGEHYSSQVNEDLLDLIVDEIEEQDAVESVPVVHAHWEPFSKTHYCGYRCSHCKTGRISNSDYNSAVRRNYCYHCGAIMDEEVCNP